MISGLLFGLFISAFLSATLLPGSSEAALVALLATGDFSPWIAVSVAAIGNTLGSCVNWVLGRFSAQFRHKKWFPISEDKFDQYTAWYAKWGVWSLLLSWAPIIGDPLTAIAGFARTPLPIFVAIVFVAKFLRYLAVAGLFQLAV